MGPFRYLIADDGRFSDELLMGCHPQASLELRAKSRGVILLGSLLRNLDTPSSSALYLACQSGPTHPRLAEASRLSASEQRLAALERALPPKDFFVANPAMKAAQLSVEFGWHGPWIAFHSCADALARAAAAARLELEEGVVEAAVLAGMFLLDEPLEVPPGARCSEAVFVQVARRPEELLDVEGPWGRYGPLTAVVERIQQYERSEP